MESYHYPEQYRHLLANTKNHELRILREEGVYRHLRFQEPGTGIWHWDLITWPGSLAIRGDVGEGFIFTRTNDMLRFFDQGQPDGWINPSYWAEKLDRGARSVQCMSPEKFAAHVRERADSLVESYFGFDAESEAEFRAAVQSEVLDPTEDCTDEGYAASVLYNFEWDGHHLDEDMDPSAWRDYEYHFILALHAILWGAKKYHAEKEGQ